MVDDVEISAEALPEVLAVVLPSELFVMAIGEERFVNDSENALWSPRSAAGITLDVNVTFVEGGVVTVNPNAEPPTVPVRRSTTVPER